MGHITGQSASRGLSQGNAYIYREADLSFERRVIEDPSAEIVRLQEALQASKEELTALQENLRTGLGAEFGHIFRAHITMVEDEEFIAEIIEVIQEKNLCAEASLDEVFSQYVELFAALGKDDYNQQRLLDLTDVYKRVLRNLLGLCENSLASIPKNSIIIATDLLPSDTALMNKDHVHGIVTEKGGVTSHVAILAKSLGIPAAVGVVDMEKILPGVELILDTRSIDSAKIYMDPTKEEWQDFYIQKKQYEEKLASFQLEKGKDAITLDGRKIELSANVGSLQDVTSVLQAGAKSVGLLRSEFFFLQSRDLPDEDTQYDFYKSVAQEFSPNMVVMRTLDIGGDKEVSCLQIPSEDNPFLGLRGIRLCLKHKEVFKTQLRAMLRAAVYGNVHIMFPMISSVVELREAKGLLRECELELKQEGVPFNDHVEVGVMIETPAAVMIADILAQECDFVSVGTNDLTQYILCADRINEHVSNYYRTWSPAVFRALHMVVNHVHAHNKWVGVCGELGGTSLAIPVLVGLGIDELSVTGQMLPEVTALIRSLRYEDCKEIATQVLSLETEEEVKTFLQKNLST